jgi:hypothetical protein
MNVTQDSRAAANRPVCAGSNTRRHTMERSPVNYRKLGSRTPYARALYAAAMAALLSACSPSSMETTPEATTTHSSETASDMPEVVVTASRERAGAIG